MKRQVKNFESIYEILEDGRIFSVKRIVPTGKGFKMMREYGGKELKQSIDRYGYAKVVLMKGGKMHYFTVHRLVAINFISDPPFEKAQVNHKDGNKLGLNSRIKLYEEKYKTVISVRSVEKWHRLVKKLIVDFLRLR